MSLTTLTPVWVLGEALMDCIAQSDGSLLPHLGGSPYNLACATALQGASVGFIPPFSTDTFGQSLLDHVQANHASSLLPRSSLPTSLAVVQVTDGQPSYGFYREDVADRDYQVDDVVALLESSPPGVLHTGSLMAMPPEHSKVLQVVVAGFNSVVLPCLQIRVGRFDSGPRLQFTALSSFELRAVFFDEIDSEV